MSGLPPLLAPWAAELAGFPPVVVSVLGPWLPALERVVGPLAAPSLHGQCEPDGYGDLSRRGSYERLVASEWLLATDAPEEFLRRAAQSEHLFLGRKLQSQTGGVRTVVLFDSGPEQLGAPRLVHLALMIVLARRARTSSAAFAWAPLQRPGHALDQESNAHAGQRLLSSRCLDVTTAAHGDDWGESLNGDPATECWAVTGTQGKASLGRGPRRWGYVTVNEPLSLQRTHLEVEVRPPHGVARKLRLPLPTPDEQVRLLRDPWNNASAAGVVRHGPLIQRHALMFLPGSHRLVVRLANGEILVHDVPNVRSNPGGSVRYLLPPGQRLIAAGAVKRRFALVTFGDGRIELVTGSRTGRVTAKLDVPDVICDDVCRPLAPARAGLFPQSAVFGDAGGVLRFWDISAGRMKPLLPKSLAYTWMGGRIVVFGQHPAGDVGLFQMEPDTGFRRITGAGLGSIENRAAYFSQRGQGTAAGCLAAIAPEQGSDSWRILSGVEFGREYLFSAFGLSVVGIGWLPGHTGPGDPALAAIDERGTAVLMLGRSETKKVASSNLPILDACLSGDGSFLAYVTEAGYVVKKTHGQVLFKQELA